MPGIVGTHEGQPRFVRQSDHERYANVYLSGFVNQQNFRYWSRQNPEMLHEKPLYSQKVMRRIIIWIIGPFLKTMLLL